jgi:acyl-CoA synthetase (AMP-forming)/AMP-acid ligase II
VEYNLADLFEHSVDHFGDRPYLIADGEQRTYAEMEARANALAHHLQAQGVGPGDHVGIYGYNSVFWVEALWAIFKLRATWININYRYVEDELAYLFGNADLKALLFQREFAPRVKNVMQHLPLLEHLVLIEDGSDTDLAGLEAVGLEEAVAGGSPERDFAPRSADDRYILYTGGTTGMPKGVVWRHEDVFMALGGGVDAISGQRVQSPQELVQRSLDNGGNGTSFFPIAPLMHGATQWGVMGQSFQGNKVTLVAKFDAAETWRLVGENGVNVVMITGDAMARPLADELEANPDKYDLSTLLSISSSAATFSPAVKDKLFDLLPNLFITDSIGSSESGANGTALVTKGNTAMKGGPTVTRGADAVVLDEDLNEMEPGTGKMGKVARKGNIPLEYYKDPEKSAETFLTGPDGTRYSMPGDFAILEDDGNITLLGRGSVSINSGGEKIFPEEVESAVKSHPAIFDCTVVGVPDERWGSRVAAVVQVRDEAELPTIEDVQEHCRTKIAGYKVPRELHQVEQIQRSPSGKPDYRWAKAVATGESVDENAAP